MGRRLGTVGRSAEHSERSMDWCRVKRVMKSITEQCILNGHFTKIKLGNGPDCFCGLREKSSFHIICKCSKFLFLRFRVLESQVSQVSSCALVSTDEEQIKKDHNICVSSSA